MRAGLYNGVPVNASYASVLAGAGRAPGARKRDNVDDVFARVKWAACTAPATGNMAAWWVVCSLAQAAAICLNDAEK